MSRFEILNILSNRKIASFKRLMVGRKDWGEKISNVGFNHFGIEKHEKLDQYFTKGPLISRAEKKTFSSKSLLGIEIEKEIRMKKRKKS